MGGRAGWPSRGANPALENFHRFLGSAEIVQALVRQIQLGKQQRTFVLILAPLVDLPPELEKLFVVLEHRLPGRAQLQQIAQEIASQEGELPTGLELEAVDLLLIEAKTVFDLPRLQAAKGSGQLIHSDRLSSSAEPECESAFSSTAKAVRLLPLVFGVLVEPGDGDVVTNAGGQAS